MSIAATLGIKITSSKFSYFATQSPDQAKYLRPNNVLCIVFSFFSFSLSLSFITRFIILLRSSRCCVLSAPIATNAEKKLFANRLKQKKDRTVVRKTNLHLLCRYVVCVCVVCGLSQVHFHLFPELVAHRCTFVMCNRLHTEWVSVSRRWKRRV